VPNCERPRTRAVLLAGAQINGEYLDGRVSNQQGEVVMRHSVVRGDVLRVAPSAACAGKRGVPCGGLNVRGYDRSTKPANVEDYRVVELVDDAVGWSMRWVQRPPRSLDMTGDQRSRPTQRFCDQTRPPPWPR
jgi:hypothetical protein